MASIRKLVTRLPPIQALIGVPKWSESFIAKDITGRQSLMSPNPISWAKYAADSHLGSIASLIHARPTAKVFAVGETHHQPSILKLQLQLLDLLGSRYTGQMVLIVEYFNLTQAQLLSDFNDSKIDVTELATAYNESSSENFDVAGHLAPLLLLAREMAIPVVAGFPPREWTREFLKDAEGILSRLETEYGFDRPCDTKSGHVAHEAYFESLLSGNAPIEDVPPGKSRMGERIFPAQLLKDAVMAWSIDQQLVKGKKVIVLAGLGHLEYGFGILERVKRVKPEEKILIVCKSRHDSDFWLRPRNNEGGEKRLEAMQPDDRAIADAIYLYDAV